MSEEFALDGSRMETLRALCDTIVPAIDHVPDPHGHWARSASSYGVPEGIAVDGGHAPARPAGRPGACCSTCLAAQGMVGASQASREQLLRNLSLGIARGRGRAGRTGWPHAPAPLRRAGPEHRPQPDLGCAGVPRAAGSSPGRAPRRSKPLQARKGGHHPGGRRGGRGLGRRRGGDRRQTGRPRRLGGGDRGRGVTSTSPTSTSTSSGPGRTCTGGECQLRPPTANVTLQAGSCLGGRNRGQLDQQHPDQGMGPASSGLRSTG